LIEQDGRVWTYGELRSRVGSARARLQQQGVGTDDRVALALGNTPAFVVAYLAALGVGAIVVPLNPTSPAQEREQQLAAVDPSAILDDPAFIEVEPDSDPASVPPIAVRRPDDVAALLFTAGTAGAPRPAILTHGNLLANIEQIQRHQPPVDGDLVLGVLPFFHIFGLNVVLGCALAAGAQVLLIDRFDRFDPPETLRSIRAHGVTVLAGPPTMYAALAGYAGPAGAPGPAANQPPSSDDSPLEIPSVRLAITGAAPLTTEVADLWQRRSGIALLQGYGLTEASPAVTSAGPDGASPTASIGAPLPGVEVMLVDEEGDEALVGDPGEIWVRGPNVFPGYWRDRHATEAALTPGGWLRTGDIAVAGSNGQLYLVDRAKDLIIVSGFNVFPAEVESVLAEHPAVAEVAVIGVEDPYQGEAVHAFVVPEAGQALDADQLADWARQRLAPYKCPSEITFVPEIPHGLAGKLLRRTLRERYLAKS
jgi:long-chain acyl-CoA synthetase